MHILRNTLLILYGLGKNGGLDKDSGGVSGGEGRRRETWGQNTKPPSPPDPTPCKPEQYILYFVFIFRLVVPPRLRERLCTFPRFQRSATST